MRRVMGTGPVRDAPWRQRRRVLARGRDAGHVVSALAQGRQLIQEQVAKGDGARGDVGDPDRSAPLAARESLAKCGHMTLDHGVEVVVVAYRSGGVAGQPRPCHVVAQQPVDGVGESLGVPGGHEEAGPAILDDLLHPAHS